MRRKVQESESVTKWQSLQVPIFKQLIDEHDFLSGYTIVTDNQYVGMEKKYETVSGGHFYVNIEIEDIETAEELDGYVVRFMRHDAYWLPANEEEEVESYPIKRVDIDDIESLQTFVDELNRGNFEEIDDIF